MGLKLEAEYDSLIRKLAEEEGIPYERLKKIVTSQYEFTKLVMESGSMDKIRLQGLGLFKTTPFLEKKNRDKLLDRFIYGLKYRQ